MRSVFLSLTIYRGHSAPGFSHGAFALSFCSGIINVILSFPSLFAVGQETSSQCLPFSLIVVKIISSVSQGNNILIRPEFICELLKCLSFKNTHCPTDRSPRSLCRYPDRAKQSEFFEKRMITKSSYCCSATKTKSFKWLGTRFSLPGRWIGAVSRVGC